MTRIPQIKFESRTPLPSPIRAIRVIRGLFLRNLQWPLANSQFAISPLFVPFAYFVVQSDTNHGSHGFHGYQSNPFTRNHSAHPIHAIREIREIRGQTPPPVVSSW